MIKVILKQIIIDKLFVYYIQDTIVQTNLNLKTNETNVILFFGVIGHIIRCTFSNKKMPNRSLFDK